MAFSQYFATQVRLSKSPFPTALSNVYITFTHLIQALLAQMVT